MAVIKGEWRLLSVCGSYQGYVAVILVSGGYFGMSQLYRTTALLELLLAAKKRQKVAQTDRHRNLHTHSDQWANLVKNITLNH